MMYAVEAKIFNSGKIVAKVRPAMEGEQEGCRETRFCDIWVDIFDSEDEARRFAMITARRKKEPQTGGAVRDSEN